MEENHQEKFGGNEVSYEDMEAMYYDWLDRNYQAHFNGAFKLNIDVIENENLVALSLNNNIFDLIPAEFVIENEEETMQICTEAAMICFVAGDRICGEEKNLFRKAGSIQQLADGLFEAVCIQAKEVLGE